MADQSIHDEIWEREVRQLRESHRESARLRRERALLELAMAMRSEDLVAQIDRKLGDG